MGKVTEDNVREWSGYLESLYNGLAGLRSGKLSGGTASSLKSAFESCKASGWADDVGVAFNANVDTCISAMDMMNTTVNGGAFNQMITGAANAQTYAREVIRLKNLKSDYARYRSNLDKDSENYSTRYAHYTELINNCDTHIKGNLDGCNEEIDKMPNYHFEGSGVTGDSGSGGGGDTSSGGDTGGGDTSAQKMAEVESKFDQDDFNRAMGDLFSFGANFHGAFTYDGQTYVISSNDGGKTFNICDASGNPIPGAPTIPKSQTQANWDTGEATYPEAEATVKGFLASR
jgi:hypothetical protein